jgi:hypothetical protein
MQLLPKQIISAEQAIALLRAGVVLESFHVKGIIEIVGVDNWDKVIRISNCLIEGFVGSVTQFSEPVILVNTCFKKCEFAFSYFLKGLTIESCIFESYLDFQAGGHNPVGYPVKILYNTFLDFVNFFDCWYKGEVSICKNDFAKGTNITSQMQLITFNFLPDLLGNIGRLDTEAESAN